MPSAPAVPGAQTTNPWRMPGAAWKDVLVRTWTQAGKDNISLAAAGVAFYGFTAMVPMLGAIVLTYGIAANPSNVMQDMTRMTAVVPADAAKLIGEQLMSVVKGSSDKKGIGLAIAIVIALYGARSGAAAVVTGLNIAYEEEEKRSFVKLTLLTLAITASAVLVALLALVAIAALGHLGDILPTLPGFVLVIGKLVSYVVLVAAGAAGAATLYRYGPDRVKAKWVWITPGSVIAASIWFLLTIAFGVYVADFGSYNATYGSLGAVVVFLTWLYLTSYILLLGAELNSEMERQTEADTTEGPDMPPGQRGAAVADKMVMPQGRRDALSTEPETAEPSLIQRLGAARGTSGLALRIGLERPGLAPTILATAGLSALRREGRAGLGAALLGLGAVLAWIDRRPDKD